MRLLQLLNQADAGDEIDKFYAILRASLQTAVVCYDLERRVADLHGAFEIYGDDITAVEGEEWMHNKNIYNRLIEAQPILNKLGAALAAFSFPGSDEGGEL